MPGTNTLHMLDLRLAERALKGEGRSQLGAGRISGQLKREESRRQKYNRHVDKECRIIRDRINSQEIKFLSIQMFKKDLNPFMVVLRDRQANASIKSAIPTEIGRPEAETLPAAVLSDILGGEPVRFQGSGIKNSTRTKLALPDIENHIRREAAKNNHHADSMIIEQHNRRPQLKLIATLNDSKLLLKPILKPPEKDKYPKFHKAIIYVKAPSQQTVSHELDRPPCKKIKNVTFFDQPTMSKSVSMLTEDHLHLQRMATCTEIPQFSEDPVRVAMAKARATLMRSRSTFLRSRPTLERSASVQTLPPRSLISASKTKTYSEVLIDTCRALSPGEARKAESKRVEAENAEGITELKRHMLKQCRKGAEIDVFSDVRWKGLITILPKPKS